MLWTGGRLGRWVIFCFEVRRRVSNTASAIRAARATAETTPAMMGVEFEFVCCAAGVVTVTGLVVKASPIEGPGVGANAVAASEREREQARQQASAEGGHRIELHYCGAFGEC